MLMDAGQQRTIAPTQAQAGLLGRAAAHVHQFLCGLYGHDALMHFEESRISLQCTSCGYETPGWDLKHVPADTQTAHAVPRAVRFPLLGERRVA